VTRRWPVVGVVLAVLWLFVRGVDATPVRLAEELLIGLLVGLPVAYGSRRFYAPTAGLTRSIRVAPAAALYVAVFLRELVTANVDVAYRVLAPSMPIDPEVIEVPLRVRTDFAITTIANSITLTPGTLTMDYDDEENTLYVHSIDGSDPESVVEPIRTWEEYALVIFDEELKPGDPVPEPGFGADGGGESPADGVGADAPGTAGGGAPGAPDAPDGQSRGDDGRDGDGDGEVTDRGR
jgi:multicomponent Na+:H+ antiporter subunit E